MELDNRIVEKANKLNWVELLAMTIYTLVIVFATIMFVGMMENTFPDKGFLRVFAQFGAGAAGGTAALMPWAKRYWIARGGMEVITYLLWTLEIVILALNSILAFDIAQNRMDVSWVGWWLNISPASPLMSIVTWGVLWVLHPHHKMRQQQMQFDYDVANDYYIGLSKARASNQMQSLMNRVAMQHFLQWFEKSVGVMLDDEYKDRIPELPADMDVTKIIEELGIGKSNGNPTKR